MDKYQGQQNNFILLSMVRTYNVGHLRVVRSLVVTMYRARLELYLLASISLSKNCFCFQHSDEEASAVVPQPYQDHSVLEDCQHNHPRPCLHCYARLMTARPGVIQGQDREKGTFRHPG